MPEILVFGKRSPRPDSIADTLVNYNVYHSHEIISFSFESSMKIVRITGSPSFFLVPVRPTDSLIQTRATEIDVMRDTCILTVDTAIVTRSIHLRVKLSRVILESIFHCVESDCPRASLDRLRVILARFTLQWIRSRITIGQLLSELATELASCRSNRKPPSISRKATKIGWLLFSSVEYFTYHSSEQFQLIKKTM